MLRAALSCFVIDLLFWVVFCSLRVSEIVIKITISGICLLGRQFRPSYPSMYAPETASDMALRHFGEGVSALYSLPANTL